MKFSIQTLIWVCVLLALLIAGITAFLPKSVDVEVASVKQDSLRVTVQEDGKTRIREKYILSAPVAGRLSRIELDAGDQVYGNKTLAAVILPAEPTMLDARARAQAEARVDQAGASLKRSEASAEQARVDFQLSQTKFDRAKKLLASKAISQDEFDFAQAQFLSNTQKIRTTQFDSEIAEYELEMARAALLQFNDDESGSEPFEVFAPISGKVLRVFQESSTVLNVGTPLIEVGDPQNLEMEIDVLSTDAVKINVGDELMIEHWGGETPLRGRVRVVEPAAFTKISSLGVEEQRVNIIADFDETPERIASMGDGYRVEADIVINEMDSVLQVPTSALFRHQRKWHVFVVNAGRAAMRPVTIGIQNDTHVEIAEGLTSGEMVILYPNDKIQEGTKVEAVP